MKRNLPLLLVVLLFGSIFVVAKPKVTIGPGTGSVNFRTPYHQKFNRTLYADTVYVLTGWYFVDSSYKLTIQPGTVIRGDSASGGTMIVSRGAQIFADGTKQNPIVFTSNKVAGTRSPGDWGGVIILGNAPTNKPTTQQIEGGFGTIPNTYAFYGGADSLDNSGILRYVRIEYGGIAFSQDNEINGLTFGGVGRGTKVEYIQVSYANDDEIECFGGCVDLKYVVTMGQIDDTFDTDYGYFGRAQFYYSVRDPNYFDASASGQSNGFESDNEGTSPYNANPRTKVRVSNFTEVGPLYDTTATINAKWGYQAMLRRATEFSIYNSVLVGWPLGITLRDTLTQRAAIDGRLEIKNTTIAVRRNPVTLSSSPTTPNITGFDPVGWFMGTSGYEATGNTGGLAPRQPSSVGLKQQAWKLDRTNDPVPVSGSEIATGTTAFDGRLKGDTWFDTTAKFRGAFNPAVPRNQQWDWGWSNYEPNNYDPELTGVNDGSGEVVNSFLLDQNYPNPFNPSTSINYKIAQSGNVKISVLNILGQEIAVIVNGYHNVGAYNVVFNAANFSSGVYLYRLESSGNSATRKMLLLK